MAMVEYLANAPTCALGYFACSLGGADANVSGAAADVAAGAALLGLGGRLGCTRLGPGQGRRPG
jgi:hypothetical protein